MARETKKAKGSKKESQNTSSASNRGTAGLGKREQSLTRTGPSIPERSRTAAPK